MLISRSRGTCLIGAPNIRVNLIIYPFLQVTFNGEQVSGSPFLCRVTDDGEDDEEILDGIAPPDFASTALDGDDGKGGLEMGRGSIKSNR